MIAVWRFCFMFLGKVPIISWADALHKMYLVRIAKQIFVPFLCAYNYYILLTSHVDENIIFWIPSFDESEPIKIFYEISECVRYLLKIDLMVNFLGWVKRYGTMVDAHGKWKSQNKNLPNSTEVNFPKTEENVQRSTRDATLTLINKLLRKLNRQRNHRLPVVIFPFLSLELRSLLFIVAYESEMRILLSCNLPNVNTNGVNLKSNIVLKSS